jgi:hypothetical protein
MARNRTSCRGPASDLRAHKLPILDAILALLHSVVVGNIGSRLPHGSAGPTEAAIERLLDTHMSQQGGPTASNSRVGPRGGLVTVITCKVRLSDACLKEVRELLDEQVRLHVQYTPARGQQHKARWPSTCWTQRKPPSRGGHCAVAWLAICPDPRALGYLAPARETLGWELKAWEAVRRQGIRMEGERLMRVVLNGRKVPAKPCRHLSPSSWTTAAQAGSSGKCTCSCAGQSCPCSPHCLRGPHLPALQQLGAAMARPLSRQLLHRTLRKAYDTVDRTFLLAVGDAVGLGPGFRAWVTS